MTSPHPDATKEALKTISQEYEKTLVIPLHKANTQWMLMPVGVLGAGKTTVMKPLSVRLGLIRISTDEVRKMMREQGYSYEGCRDVTHELSKKYLDLGYSIAIDANTGSTNGLEYNKKTAEQYPYVRQLFIHINPPDEFIVNKLKNYEHTWLFPDSEKAVEGFYKNKETFQVPDLPFVYTFDTSRSDLAEQIEECAHVIEKSLR